MGKVLVQRQAGGEAPKCPGGALHRCAKQRCSGNTSSSDCTFELSAGYGRPDFMNRGSAGDITMYCIRLQLRGGIAARPSLRQDERQLPRGINAVTDRVCEALDEPATAHPHSRGLPAEELHVSFQSGSVFKTYQMYKFCQTGWQYELLRHGEVR